MAKKSDLCRDKRGLYVRNLGWTQTASGRYSQVKFYLGRDEATAKIASLKLEQLWDVVCRRWKAETPVKIKTVPGSNSAYVKSGATDLVTGLKQLSTGAAAVVSVGAPEIECVREGKPVWEQVSLAIAEAIRNGEPIARVPVPKQLEQFGSKSPSVGHWLDALRRDVPFMVIQLRDLERHQEAEEQIRNEGNRLIEQGRRMVRQDGGGETLHAALAAYIRHLEKKHVSLDGRVNATGTTQVRQTEFLRDTLPDLRLVELDTQNVLILLDTLAKRPVGKRGKRIAARTARNYIKQFRQFIRWLNLASGFSWKRPADLEFTTTPIPESPQEKAAAARTSRVQTYSTDEIRVLWEYATPLKRLLLLLGLNCGFDAKMIATLQSEDVHLHEKHPHEGVIGCSTSVDDSWIFRLRNKTSVYGEWKLWPITVMAIEWWLRQRSNIEIADDVTALLVNRNGLAYDTPTKRNDRNVQIPNLWSGLTDTIQNDDEHKDFRRLSFGKLRKTAGNLIRLEADGEVAGVFLCHGTPVKADKLLDEYTNRPFARMFETIDIVGQRLSPIWASADTPFPETRKKGGANIPASKIRKIQRMRKAGYKVARIAEEVGVDKNTVYRWGKQPRKGSENGS